MPRQASFSLHERWFKLLRRCVFAVRRKKLDSSELKMEDPPTLASLSLTHVHYDPTDKISYISAWLALVPQGLCIMYVTLIWATREVEILMMFGGQMACEALNWGLKRYIKEDRPKQMNGKGYGMPSSHAQFVAFFSVSLTFFLLLRHQTTHHTSYRPSSQLERLSISLLACSCAGLVAASRYYLNYHTPKQIWVGVAAGLGFALAWFLVTTLLRKLGWIEWALELDISRNLRFRDLILTEDLQDAGWGRWEDWRKSRRQALNGPIRSSRKTK